MRVRCYVPMCVNTTEMHWLVYLWACLKTRSFHPWVCKDHYDLFREDDTWEDLMRGGRD